VVLEWDPPRRMVVEHRGLVSGPGEWRIEPAGSGSRFTWVDDLTMPPPLLGSLALFIYSPVLRWNFRRTMRNLARRTGAPDLLP